MRLPAFVCLSVCLSEITKNACMDLDETLRAGLEKT